MTEAISCWRCGEVIAGEDLPLSRQSRCRHCGVDLYVCRLCRHYNPRLSRKCEQDQAEPARDVAVANFCDWFEATALPAGAKTGLSADAAAEKLAALFGESSDSPAGDAEEDPAARMAAMLREAEKKHDD